MLVTNTRKTIYRTILEDPEIDVEQLKSDLHERGIKLSLTALRCIHDDFAAAMRFLHEQGYLNPKRLKDQTGFCAPKRTGLRALIPAEPEPEPATKKNTKPYKLWRFKG